MSSVRWSGSASPSPSRVEFAGLRFEIQIRTIAQGAWAEVAHEQLYKPPADVPAHLKRRIYRLVSLVELFDNEVEAFLVEAAQTPGYREAVALQPLAQLLLQRFGVSRRPDRQLSLVIAAAVVSLYDCGPAEVPSRIEAWIEENAQKLETVLAGCLAGSCAPILLQPESFLIFERLERDADRLLEAWPPEVPRAWLDEAAVAWGVRLPDTENQADESLADYLCVVGRGHCHVRFAAEVPHRRSSQACDRMIFSRRLEAPVRDLHRNPDRLRHSARLADFISNLYSGELDRAWSESIEPFLERERSRLEVIYAQHAAIPTARCLDDYEGLALVERLHTTPDRVRDEWPLEPAELEALADAAGVRIAAF